jgi:hypothetical protein
MPFKLCCLFKLFTLPGAGSRRPAAAQGGQPAAISKLRVSPSPSPSPSPDIERQMSHHHKASDVVVEAGSSSRMLMRHHLVFKVSGCAFGPAVGAHGGVTPPPHAPHPPAINCAPPHRRGLVAPFIVAARQKGAQRGLRVHDVVPGALPRALPGGAARGLRGGGALRQHGAQLQAEDEQVRGAPLPARTRPRARARAQQRCPFPHPHPPPPTRAGTSSPPWTPSSSRP